MLEKIDISHYLPSYYWHKNSIWNLENIISEIESSMESLTEINTWLTTLHDIITQEGKRKIFAISENELIKREKKILSAIAVLKWLWEIENEVQLSKENIKLIASIITKNFRDYILPLLNLPL